MQHYLDITAGQAIDRLDDELSASTTAAAVRRSPGLAEAGYWFDPATGTLAVAVTDQADADRVRALGATPRLVSHSGAELATATSAITELAARSDVPGLATWGVDPQANRVIINVDSTRRTAATRQFLASAQKLGDVVEVRYQDSSPRQQGGTVNPGDPWWPGSESNCSVGFPTTDAVGGKHFLTAGHCTNDRDQPAYGASGSQDRLGTSNVGGARTVNAPEGDFGVVAVNQTGWDMSAAVNTWGSPAVTVTGSVEPVVGQSVCHSGNTSKWQCGTVTAINQTVDYGSVTVAGLATTTACSMGGDSGGAWLAGTKAVGLHSGGASSCSPGGANDQSIFQPVNEVLTKYNLTLLTGSDQPGAVTVTNPGNQSSLVNQPVSLANRATGGTAPYAWSVTGLPAGLSIDRASGTISGTPTTAGTSSVTLTVTDASTPAKSASASLTWTVNPADTGGRTLSSTTAYPIRDYQSTSSPIRSTLSGAAATRVTVVATIRHTCVGDLGISLIDPQGRAYALKYSGSGSYPCVAWDGPQTFTASNVSSVAAGTWTLRVTDYGPGDIGTLSGWKLTL